MTLSVFFLRTRIVFRYFAGKDPGLDPGKNDMKRMLFFGCLGGILLSAACERLDDDRTLHTGERDYIFTLEDVAQLLAAVPVGDAQVGEVKDAVSASSDNGYDTEYTMKDLFLTPGAGVGSETATRVEAYPEPLRDLITAAVRKTFGDTRSMDAETFLDALSGSDVQIYWPYSEEFEGGEMPVVTFDPGDNSVRNIGYLRREDGTVEEVIVDEDMARERPVWVVNRNADAEYKSLEMRRREDPDWGQGGLITAGTRASGKNYFQTLVLRSFQANRQYDSWFAGGSEFFVKCGAVEDFTASTDAELRLYSPSVTDFLIVVKRSEVGKPVDFNAVLVSEWTGMLDNCAFMMVEDDGGALTTWKCSAMVKYNSKSYGFDIEIPLHTRDDIVWRGALTRTYIERNSGAVGHFGDVDLVLELI